MTLERLKFPSLVMGVGLGLGLFADLLLYDKPTGISIPIIMAAILLGLFGLAALEKSKLVWVNIWLVIPLLFLAMMSAVRAQPALRLFNVLGALGLVLLLGSVLMVQPHTRLNLGRYVANLIEAVLASGLVLPFPLLSRAFGELRQQDESSKSKGRGVVLGLLIALPFLCVFTVLFASADLLFDAYVEDLIGELTIGKLVGHTMLTMLLSWLVMGGLAYALSRRQGATTIFEARSSTSDDKQVGRMDIRNLLGPVESSVVLFSIDVLFILFVAIQFAALFGGEAFLQRQGLSYSDYARRGFFELVAVSLITLALILTLDFVTRRKSHKARLTFLLGSGLMLLLTIVMLVSAFQRLQLYELAFGFTTLRLFTHVFMIWLALLLGVFLVMLVSERTALFATALLVVTIGFVGTLDILNPDAVIVAQNVRRFKAGEELDVAYIGNRSADALPGLLALVEGSDPALRNIPEDVDLALLMQSSELVDNSIDALDQLSPELREILADPDERVALGVGGWLHQHLNQLDRRQDRAAWPSFHFSFNRGYKLLDAERAMIESFATPPYWLRRDGFD